jgi:hypothetical protein
MKRFKIYSMTTQENELPLEPEKVLDEEKKNVEKSKYANSMSLYQRMRSALVTKGYEGLTDDERAYWNSVY